MTPDESSEHATADTDGSPFVLEVGPASPEQFHWLLDQIEAAGEIKRFRIEIESDAPVRHPLSPDASEQGDERSAGGSSAGSDESTGRSAVRNAAARQAEDQESNADPGASPDTDHGDGDADEEGTAETGGSADGTTDDDAPRVQPGSETFALLRVLAERDEWLRTEEIGDAIPDGRDLDQQTIASLLWQLGDRDLVEKRPYEEDRRKTEYRVTDRGRAAFDSARDDGGADDETGGGGSAGSTNPAAEDERGPGDGDSSSERAESDAGTRNAGARDEHDGADTADVEAAAPDDEVAQLLEAMAVWESHLRRSADEWREEVSQSAEEYRRGLAEGLGVEPEDVPDEAVEHWKEGVMETDAEDLTASVTGGGSDWLAGIYEGVTGREPPERVAEVARDVEGRALDRVGDDPSDEELLDAVRDELRRAATETRTTG